MRLLVAFAGVNELSVCGNRVRRPRYFTAFEFFGVGSAHEDSGHVWMWRARVCTGLRVVSATSCAGSRTLIQIRRAANSLSELVVNGKNGVIFQNAVGLVDQLEVTYVLAVSVES